MLARFAGATGQGLAAAPTFMPMSAKLSRSALINVPSEPESPFPRLTAREQMTNSDAPDHADGDSAPASGGVDALKNGDRIFRQRANVDGPCVAITRPIV